MANINFSEGKIKNWGLFLSILAILTAAFFVYTSSRPQYQPIVSPLPEGTEESSESQLPSPPENMPQFPTLYQSEGSLEAAVIFDEPSLYGRVTVFDQKDIYNRVLMIDGVEQGGWSFRANKSGRAVREIDLFFQNYLKDIEDILVIGLGGGTLLKTWEGENFKVDAVEINPTVVEVAKEYFVLPENLDYKIITDDGRHFLRTTDKKYDVIILDLCDIIEANAHLWTDEFFKLATSKLKTDSSVVIASLNIIGDEDSYHLEHMVANTLIENFKNLYAISPPANYQFAIINFFATDEFIDISLAQDIQLEEWEFNLSYSTITDKEVAKIVQYHYPILEFLRETTIRNFGISFLLER